MEELIGLIIFAVFAFLTSAGKAGQQQKGRQGTGRTGSPQWPGPVAGPNFPRSPWPAPKAERRDVPGKPSAAPGRQVPQWPDGASDEGAAFEGTLSMEGRRSEGTGSIEGRRSEGQVADTVAEERARFISATEAFARAPQTALHHPGPELAAPQAGEASPVLAALSSQQGLAQAVLLAEVLDKPRALRPYSAHLRSNGRG